MNLPRLLRIYTHVCTYNVHTFTHPRKSLIASNACRRHALQASLRASASPKYARVYMYVVREWYVRMWFPSIGFRRLLPSACNMHSISHVHKRMRMFCSLPFVCVCVWQKEIPLDDLTVNTRCCVIPYIPTKRALSAVQHRLSLSGLTCTHPPTNHPATTKPTYLRIARRERCVTVCSPYLIR